MSVHPVAARGFDAGAGRYERGRPSYPPEAVELLCAELRIGTNREVLDLAAGTGKLTRMLVPTGARLVAVEPLAGMRRVLAEALPAVPLLEGTAEAIPLPDASMDAVVVGQAFHWFDGPAALAEIARVLRPGGGLGLVWNLGDESTPWVAALGALLDRHTADTPRYRDLAWRTAFTAPSPTAGAGAPFGPLHERCFRFDHVATAAGHRDSIASISFVACLRPEVRRALLAEVDALLAGQVRADGTLVMPHRTHVHWCHRR